VGEGQSPQSFVVSGLCRALNRGFLMCLPHLKKQRRLVSVVSRELVWEAVNRKSGDGDSFLLKSFYA
jgi:hypothetical protein